MIPFNISVAFFTAIFTIIGRTILTKWVGAIPQAQVTAVGNITAVKKELEPEKKKKILFAIPDDYEGEPETVGTWCRWMTVYFQASDITNPYDRIMIAVSKVKKGKEGRAQKWADKCITDIVPFRKEYNEKLRSGGYTEATLTKVEIEATFQHKPAFYSWNEMISSMEHFFISRENQANAIEKLRTMKQGNQRVEEYCIDFNTWRSLTGYNEIALVGMFREGLHPGLSRRLMEVARLSDTDSLETWCKNAVEFERSWRWANRMYGTKGKGNTTTTPQVKIPTSTPTSQKA